MKRTAENLHAHELVGLKMHILHSPDPKLVGQEGIVMLESMKTMHVLGKRRRMVIPKQHSEFLFTLEDGSTVRVRGNDILGRPEERVAL